ncbi:MAG: heavy-metal-associated domain-containing protein [Defluviimonas sp.]|uniref:heavy-metal-associated domain-containing protein n=1 Tax=Albidovulum sp. TaxID=1872424 RepID=UPI001D4D42FB|nr:heavy-metal-associated domain-containing protein [Paracoccaceae bacterium]MCC0065282.1 heavy-metal-associated domain-containing protein [Defluviimonas sp.]
MKFSIPDMSCSHCQATVERTIIDIDSRADVVVDLTHRTVEVTSTAVAEAILAALAAEGFPAKLV